MPPNCTLLALSARLEPTQVEPDRQTFTGQNPDLKLKPQPRQLLSYLPLDIVPPWESHRCHGQTLANRTKPGQSLQV
jgi:hypothetical protein